MDLSKLKSGAKAATLKAIESDHAAPARRLASGGTAILAPRIRALIDMDEDTPITPETLLGQAIAAVRVDEEESLTLDDVRDAGKRKERLVAAAGILGGGPGCVIADLYADAAVYCLLDRHLALGLSDEEIAAHLLVSWNAAPGLPQAKKIMDPDDPASIADQMADRFQDEFSLQTKRSSLLALWRLRSGLARMPLFDPTSFKDLFRTGWSSKKRLEEAAAQLDLPPSAIDEDSILSLAG